MKNIYRSSSDRKFMGVCGGTAEWLKADATFVRLFTVAAVMFSGGAVLVVYLAAGLLLRDGESPDSGTVEQTGGRWGASASGRTVSDDRPVSRDAFSPLMSDSEEQALRGDIARLHERMAFYEAHADGIQSACSRLPK
jgi:phage shock protein PspC (stress-responsive transcriptional regulator)